MDRRTLLKTLAAAIAQRLNALPAANAPKPSRRLVLVTIGGIRRQESFSQKGIVNVPRLFNDLLPQSLFYPYTVNEGVTSHFNAIASILTGVWQRVDDWGSEKPAQPTLFEYWQRNSTAQPQRVLGRHQQQAAHRQHQPGRQRRPRQATTHRGRRADHHGPKLSPPVGARATPPGDEGSPRNRLRAHRLGRALHLHLPRPRHQEDLRRRSRRLHSRPRRARQRRRAHPHRRLRSAQACRARPCS